MFPCHVCLIWGGEWVLNEEDNPTHHILGEATHAADIEVYGGDVGRGDVGVGG